MNMATAAEKFEKSIAIPHQNNGFNEVRDEYTGKVEGYQTLFEAIKSASPVPIVFEDIKSGAKGYIHTEENRISINNGMSEIKK